MDIVTTLPESAAVARKQLARILTDHGPAVTRAAASYARNAAERDDLLQEIALALVRAMSTFRGECSERAFVLRVAHNQGITYSTRRRPSEELDCERFLGDAPDPERVLEQKQRTERLRRAIHTLPLGHRQVITLFLEDLSHDEIADVLGISVTNVGVRLHRARALLRIALGDKS